MATVESVAPGRLKRSVDEFERRLILAAMASSGWNQRAAARALGVLATTLNAKIKRLGIPSRPGMPVEVPERASLPDADAREEFVWEGMLAAGRTLEIDGVTGSFRAEVATSDSVRLVATKHGTVAERRSVTITVNSSRRGVVVRARAERLEAGGVTGALARIDVAVQVPNGVRLLVRRSDGLLDLAQITGTIHVPAASPGARPGAVLPALHSLRRRA